MKNKKRISSFILAVLMFITLNSFSIMAYAAEQGTESNPYQITTAQELQNINDNVSAHYKLMADIDLKNAEFTPIGNADSGAFSGSFDGNGYTISNLNVFSGKYAGLFGCNEGTIKNVTLKDIYVYGTRYIGGVVGENTSLGTISDCKVLSGKIESDGGLNDINAGGICGSNNGAFEGELSNGADLEISNNSNSRAGGIVGLNGSNIILTASNTGNINSKSVYNDSCSGGIIAYSNSTCKLDNCINRGFVTADVDTGRSVASGIIAQSEKHLTICNSHNFNEINSNGTQSNHSSTYAAGILGCALASVDIIYCYNYGNIISEFLFAGGIVGYSNEVFINSCKNSGNISVITSFVSSSGGIVGSTCCAKVTLSLIHI